MTRLSTFMQQSSNRPSFDPSLRVFESSQIHDQAELDPGDFIPGVAHYSYKLARNKLVNLFKSRDITVRPLKRPEIYATPLARAQIFEEGSQPLHLIFKPFEHIRVLKKAVNIACLAWEFSETLSEVTATHPILPTQDYVRMARAVQEIWTPSTFAKNVFAKAGILNCEVVPAPIGKPTVVRHARAKIPNLRLYSLSLSAGWFDISSRNISAAQYLPAIVNGVDNAKIFLMVFNPGDRRKNPTRALKAFAALKRRFKNAVLVIKFVSHPSIGGLENIIKHDILPFLVDFKVIEPGVIWVTDEFMPNRAFEELVACSSFFVCTSFCEGQNLPLLESMAAGVVPISVDHTAMADYINERNAIVIPSRETKEQIAMSFAANISGATWYDCSDRDVFLAFVRAMSLSDLSYGVMSQNAVMDVENICGEKVVWEKIARRIEALRQ